MSASGRAHSWSPYVPSLAISTLILAAGLILGGPVAAAIAAIAVLPSLLTSSVLTYLVLIRYSPPTITTALALGFGLYACSAVVVLICLSVFGPSQIM